MTTREIYNAQAEALEWADEQVGFLAIAKRAQELRALAAQSPEGEPVDYDWMDEARQFAAQCWCDAETRHKEMDATLCEAVAMRIASWMRTGAQHARNEEYWRNRALVAEAHPAPAPAYPDFEGIPSSAAQQAERIATLDAQLAEAVGLLEAWLDSSRRGETCFPIGDTMSYIQKVKA